MTIRERLEEKERKTLSPFATFSEKSQRVREERLCPFRTAFQKDRDKILHSKSFRRLKYKTQVFLSPLGDHYRTRLTHSLEVMQIGRTLARALELNEDLVEAATLGHDLGHTPFGHSGEAILNEIHPGGFHHAKQSVRIVTHLERGGEGLNLTEAVVEAIEKHSKGKGPIISEDPGLTAQTLEGQVVRLADIMAYINHDLDDALRAGVLKQGAIPRELKDLFGDSHSERVETMVSDVIEATVASDFDRIRMSPEGLDALTAFRAFMFENVYETDGVAQEFKRAKQAVKALYFYYLENPKQLLREMGLNSFGESLERHVLDFVSGMTDRYAIRKYQELVTPKPWRIF